MPLVGIPFCGRLFPQVESALGFLVTLASARTFRFLAVFAQSGSGEQLSATFRLSFPPLSLSLSLGSSSFSLFVFVWKGNEIEIPFRSRSRSWLRQLGGRAGGPPWFNCSATAAATSVAGLGLGLGGGGGGGG